MALSNPTEASRIGRTYLMVLPVKFFPVSEGRFAGESAFCEHLRMWKAELGDSFARLVVAGPRMSEEEYARTRPALGELDAAKDGIEYRPLHPADEGRIRFWKGWPSVVRRMSAAIRESDVVHSGISEDIYRPFEFTSLVLGAAHGKTTVSISDIDHRESARMAFETGRMSRRAYLVSTLLHDRLRDLQLRAAVKLCSLVLLKGKKLASDYGHGQSHVRDFLDTAYSATDIISSDALERKIATLHDPEAPLELVYFGRLTGYKGVDHCLRALRVAVDAGSKPFRFHVIGGGEEREALEALSSSLGLSDRVIFHGAVRFGPELFEKLASCHVLLAAPLSEDTPRSALDAMASGISLVAYDTYYYRDLQASGAVQVVPWRSVEALGSVIAALSRDKAALVPRARAAVRFARDNTQELWLRRRAEWTLSKVPGVAVEAARTKGSEATVASPEVERPLPRPRARRKGPAPAPTA